MHAFRIAFAIVSIALAAGCTGSQQGGRATRQKAPKNIVFLIGDGMGLSQLSSAYFYGSGEPNFSRFKDLGLIKTSSSSDKITDSAAGATAFASGIKTYNGAIGVAPDTNSVPTIMEELSAKGWATGLISTSSITHATPACFFAHAKLRKLEEDIAVQMVTSQVDFFAGGGKRFFFKNRSDGRNLLPDLEAQGFIMDTTGIDKPIDDYSKRYGYLLADKGLDPKHQGRDDYLAQASAKALDYFSKQGKPFFLMIESSQIDWGGHDNDADYLIAETLEFDRVIGLVLDFAAKDGNTLVVVTADHETGGYTLSSETKKNAEGKSYSDYNSISPTFSTGGHSATLVPVFAWGPGSDKFRGIYENTHIHKLFSDLAGLK